MELSELDPQRFVLTVETATVEALDPWDEDEEGPVEDTCSSTVPHSVHLRGTGRELVSPAIVPEGYREVLVRMWVPEDL